MSDTREKKDFKIETSTLRAYTMLGALVVIWLTFHYITQGIFLTPRNLSNLMLQTSVTGIIAVGMLMLIVAGQIDLSVGSVLGLAGGIGAIALASGFGVVPAILMAIVVAVIIESFQGALTAYLNIPAFIVTLGGLLAWRGVLKWITAGNTIPIANDTYKIFGQADITPASGWVIAGLAVAGILALAYRKMRAEKSFDGANVNHSALYVTTFIQIAAVVTAIYLMNSYNGVPMPVLIFLIVALLGSFITNSTTFGRYLYAIGGNADAARLSGINNKLNILKVYALLGAFTGIAAIISSARVSSVSPDAGTLKELDAIAACVIGGASLVGGRGTIFGACLGALIMASLDNGMSLYGVRDFMQDIIKGAILVAAVGIDMLGKKHS